MSVLQRALRISPPPRRDVQMPFPDYVVRLRAFILQRLPADLSQTAEVMPVVLCNNEEEAKALGESADTTASIPGLEHMSRADSAELGKLLCTDMFGRSAKACTVSFVRGPDSLMILLAWGPDKAIVTENISKHFTAASE